MLIPNQTIGQNQILIFSARTRPFRVGYAVRIPFQHSIEDVKTILVGAVNEVVNLPLAPAPKALLMEISESWFTIKIFYLLYDYGERNRVGDRVLETIVRRLQERSIPFAVPSYNIIGERDSRPSFGSENAQILQPTAPF